MSTARTQRAARAKARDTGKLRQARSGDLWTFRTSSFAWVGLSVVAGAYLVSLVGFDGLPAFRDSEFKSVTDRLMPRRVERPVTAPPADETRDDSVLRASLIKLTAETRILRRAVNELRQRNDVLESRLASLENAIGPATSALSSGHARKRADVRARAGVPPVSIAISPLPADGFGDSSLSTTPVPMAAPKAPSRTMFGAELATGTTRDALRVQWQGLRARHPTLLAGLEIRRAGPAPGSRADGKDRLRLVVGPFKNAADAARLCARLRAANTSCRETVFSGEAL